MVSTPSKEKAAEMQEDGSRVEDATRRSDVGQTFQGGRSGSARSTTVGLVKLISFTAFI